MTGRSDRDDDREYERWQRRRQEDDRGMPGGMRDDDYGRSRVGGSRGEDWRGQGQQRGAEYDRYTQSGYDRTIDEERGGYSQRGMSQGGRMRDQWFAANRGQSDYGEFGGQGEYGSYGGWSGRGSQGGYGGQGYMGGQSQMGGQYAGRGPKGYKRSDERIMEEVCEQLTRQGDVDASDIDVTVREGEVTLTGTVNDRRMKRIAAECIEDISGVHDVHNQIRVRQEQSRQIEQGQMGQSQMIQGQMGQQRAVGGSGEGREG